MIPTLILAAGTSSRMRGVDKLLQDVDGVPLLRRQIDTALGLGGAVYVALPHTNHARMAVVSETMALPLIVPEAAGGMGCTLRGAVRQLPDCPAFMVLLADLVALDASDLRCVYDAYARHPNHLIWRGATDVGKPGHPIIFAASLRPDFTKLSGDTGGESLAAPLRSQTCLVPLPGNRARLDLDTPEDWAAWRASRPV